jgi:hypothetical protein
MPTHPQPRGGTDLIPAMATKIGPLPAPSNNFHMATFWCYPQVTKHYQIDYLQKHLDPNGPAELV